MQGEGRIGERELVEWVEKLLKRKNFHFRTLKDGDVYLQLFGHIWPQVMKKYVGSLCLNPRNDTNRGKNWKVIREVLTCVNIDKSFVNFEKIINGNFMHCYESLIVLYFLHSLVKNHECDFVLAYQVNSKLTAFMSSEKPLICLAKAGSVQLPERGLQKMNPPSVDENIFLSTYKKGVNISDTKGSSCEILPSIGKSCPNEKSQTYSFIRDCSVKGVRDTINAAVVEGAAAVEGAAVVEDEAAAVREKFKKGSNCWTFEGRREPLLQWVKQADINSEFAYTEEEYRIASFSNTSTRRNYNASGNSSHMCNHLNNDKLSEEKNTHAGVNKCGYDEWESRSIRGQDNRAEEENLNRAEAENLNRAEAENLNRAEAENLNRAEAKNLNRAEEENLNHAKEVNHYHMNSEGNFENENKDTPYNLSDICTPPQSNFFKYLNANKGESISRQSAPRVSKRENVTLPNLNLPKFANLCNDTYRGMCGNAGNHVRNVACQTNADAILHLMLNDTNVSNLEVIWKGESQKIKGESFVFFLKTQIEMYKKELHMKENELQLVQKVKQKEISSMKKSHFSEIINIRETYEAKIAHLKHQHLENITKVRKNFEEKLGHLEEDLLLDLDVLTCENENVNYSTKTEKETKLSMQREKCHVEDNHVEIFPSHRKHFHEGNKSEAGDTMGRKNYNNDIPKKEYFLNFDCTSREDHAMKASMEHLASVVGKTEFFPRRSDFLVHNNDYRVHTTNQCMRNNVDASLEKIKHVMREKNKEHELNNEYIKNELLHIKSLLCKIHLRKEKEENEKKRNNEMFYEILECMNRFNDDTNRCEVLEKDSICIEKVKKEIYTIIGRKQCESLMNEDVKNMLDENVLTRLVVHLVYFLRIERVRGALVNVKKERNIFIKNYIRNKHGIDESPTNKHISEKTYTKEMHIDETASMSSEMPSSEITIYEKTMEAHEKIKSLETKNKKLQCMNEYYKKKLEHLEIWRTALDHFTGKTPSNGGEDITNKDNNVNGNMSYLGNNIHVPLSEIREGIKTGIENHSLSHHSITWFPQLFLRTHEEENERDAELMFLLKKLGRNTPHQHLSAYDSVHTLKGVDTLDDLNLFQNDSHSSRCIVSESLSSPRPSSPPSKTHNNDSSNYGEDANCERKDKTREKNHQSYIYRCNYNSDRNSPASGQSGHGETNNRLCARNCNEFRSNDFQGELKKKLTYIFWQIVGDIYKYRNAIQQACDYINNLNNVLEIAISKNAQKVKEEKKEIENDCTSKENMYMSEKYKLRKIIGKTKLHMDVYKDQYNDLKEEYEREKKNIIILTNACYENESTKYKHTIMKFKKLENNFRICKAREKKWNKLVKLLTMEIRNPSNDNQEKIKNVWLEIVATKWPDCKQAGEPKDERARASDGDGDADGSGDGSGDSTSYLNQDMAHFASLMEQFSEKRSPSGCVLPMQRAGYKGGNENLGGKKSEAKNETPNGEINHGGEESVSAHVSAGRISAMNYYKDNFSMFLDNIISNTALQLRSSSSEAENVETDPGSAFSDSGMSEEWNPQPVSPRQAIQNGENERCVKMDGVTNTERDRNCGKRDSTHSSDVRGSRVERGFLVERGKNWVESLSGMARESCVMFQKILNIKEDEIREKRKKISYLEEEIRELKKENMKKQNKYQCLEEQHEYLKKKLNCLKINVENLNAHIFSLNRDKIFLESRQLTKLQELNMVILNYKAVVTSIRMHIKKNSSVLHLLDTLPQEDEKRILHLVNAGEKDNIGMKFSRDMREKDVDTPQWKHPLHGALKREERAGDSQVLASFSNLRSSALNDINKSKPDFCLGQLINDIEGDLAGGVLQ
ncbi:calponin homology domain-containing protein, putative [Plasmodium ovale wallikeri]|uniref:Calponin homology domain-containing protein, putative n=1 Tax=Plasmodium ovale wallikeri TaxID=864142 RepID=A0A1A8ZH37_PLAOA|nr:calponin homology domain-containing protein, putative [Plasmodium ovale wallikeri]